MSNGGGARVLLFTEARAPGELTKEALQIATAGPNPDPVATFLWLTQFKLAEGELMGAITNKQR